MESGRVAAQTLEFGAWFDLIVGGAYSQGIQGITVDAEKARNLLRHSTQGRKK